MPNATIQVLSVKNPGNSLSVWLAGHHPDLFLTMLQHARQQQASRAIQSRGLKGFRGLGQDDGTTTTFDTADTFDPSVPTTVNIPGWTPGEAPSTPSVEPDLQTLTLDTSQVASLPADLVTDATPAGTDFLTSIGNATTSAGSTIGSVLGTGVSGVLSALGSVGSVVASPAGLNLLGQVAKSYFGAQAANAQAQTQQAVLATQIARTTTGNLAAPITYAPTATGSVVPVYQTQTPNGPVYQTLSSQGLASLTPSSISVFFSQYQTAILIGAAVLLAFVVLKD
jgi:hypothetical protein